MFEKIIGNEDNKKYLETVLNNNRTSHSYMFTGIKGIGKSLFAKEFAKGILCTSDNKPCLNCKSCIEFENNNNPDFYYITVQEDDKSIKIDQIREMQKKVQELPIVSNKKVYIIDNSELMTTEAQNCLLKTIEEPPEFVTVILITSNENKILNTIKSRCLKIHFKGIEDKILKEYLEKTYKIDNISENMLKSYNGSIGKAIALHEKENEYKILDKVFSNIEKYNIIQVIKELEILYKNKENAIDFLEYINVILINKAKDNINYVEYINIVEDIKKKLYSNCNYDMTIDSLLFKIWNFD